MKSKKRMHIMEIENDLKAKIEPFLKGMSPNMGDALGIKFTLFSRDRVEAVMPVNDNTRQPFGLLHGGASVALGETICSIGAWLNLDSDSQSAVGVEINANHIRAVRDGMVKGTATPIHRGASSQVWVYEIRTEDDKLVCSGRCTLTIIKKRA